MQVLVIEPDQNFRLFLRRSIEADGHQVVAVARHSEGVTAVRSGGVDTVLVGLEPGDSEVADALHAIRAAAGQAPLQALLYSAFYEASDPELRDLLRLFARYQFLPKPFTTADLRDRLGRLLGGGPVTLGPLATGPYARPPSAVGDTLAPPRPPHSHEEMPGLAQPRQAVSSPRAGTAAPYRPPDMRNALILNRIWATRLTGVAALNGGPDGAHGWATVARGGPADAESRALLEAALYGGDLTFEATQVNATGDWEALGNFLYHGLRDPSQGRFAQENRFQALHRTAASHLALHLPISLATRRLIARADGQTTLGELLAREGIDPVEVSHELHILRLLRQVELQEPVAPPPRRELPVETAPPGQQGAFGTASTTSGSALRSSHTGSVPPLRSVSNPGAARPDAMSRSIGGASAVVQAPRSRPIIPPASGQSHSTSRSALSGLNSVQRSSPTASSSATASATVLGSGREQIAMTLRRLTREAHDLAVAEPAVVLGIPISSDAELVRHAAERQRVRYTAMSRDPSLPAEARQLAKQILDRVDDAERGFARSRAQSTPKIDEEMLLTFARDLIGKRNWDQAEKALRKARQLRPDHASVLANLGWTILCNPTRSADQRTEEARELLLLSEQFDPNNADGQYYLAELLYRLGEYAAALPRAERAIKAQPDLVAATTLARRLRVKLTGGS